MADPTADVFVAFGITGDLAKEMTFRSLYRLERRGLLHCRIVGVALDDWTTARLRRHMRDSIKARGEKLDRKVFDRLAARVSYIQGDFGDPATYERLATAIGNAGCPVFYLETPPSLFGKVVKGLAGAGLAKNARVVIEKPFGHDFASAQALAAELHRSISEKQIFRVDHFLGKLGLEELLYLRYANTMLEPVWNSNHVSSVQITMAERFGVEDRGRFYDAVGALRDVVVNHLLQLTAAATMEAPLESETLDDARHRLLKSVADADPTRYVRGQYTGYRTTPGVASRSTTETYAALELRIDNERWQGVPFYIRTGKHLPITQTELRLIFRDASPLSFLAKRKQPGANELVIRTDPATGIRMILEAHRADAPGPEPITLDMEFSEQGGEGPTPYETLIEAALDGDHTLFTRQETIEEAWRIIQPLLNANRRTHSYRRGSWGPAAANRLLENHHSWRPPWPLSQARP
jgi:glucose-6-phosphate 1-dehydrogenase